MDTTNPAWTDAPILATLLLYLMGVMVVLGLRPDAMFSADGTWKEFGVGGRGRTLLPFWLFAILWAFLSFAAIQRILA
jgi:hypothetical protein